MATLGEIMRDPSKTSKEDIENFEGIVRILKEFKENAKPYESISLDSGRNISEISQRVYQENLILSAIIEAFVFKKEYKFNELNTWVFNYVDKDFIWDVSVPYYRMCIAKLCKLQLLNETKENEEDNNPHYTITDKGMDSLREQIFSNLAQSSLYNYQASKMNEQSISINKSIKRITWGALITAIVSAVISLLALTFTIFR
ncbi:MAG: hypothetical protein IK013_03475 [Bacteroidales bacterium]|nr:hypothetical protein [Bacteroidales bacterium]